MKRIFLSLFLLTTFCQACEAQQTLTTFILVRHAEKADDGTKDPDLTTEGKQRAEDLASLLIETKVDAIYSTSYKRTRNTVAPLASAKKLNLLSYDPMKGEELDVILDKFRGGTVVLCGHSNTTPWVANYFLGREEFYTFEDSDYDNLFILSIVGKGNAKVTRLRYGAVSK